MKKNKKIALITLLPLKDSCLTKRTLFDMIEVKFRWTSRWGFGMIDDWVEWQKGQGLNSVRGRRMELMEILDSFFCVFKVTWVGGIQESQFHLIPGPHLPNTTTVRATTVVVLGPRNQAHQCTVGVLNFAYVMTHDRDHESRSSTLNMATTDLWCQAVQVCQVFK